MAKYDVKPSEETKEILAVGSAGFTVFAK